MTVDMQKDQERATLIAAMSTSFMVAFMGSAVNLSLPAMAAEFSGTAAMTSWIVTSYLLASAAFLLPIGRIADMVGRRKIYLAGTVLYTLITFITTLSHAMSILIAYRILQGIAAAMIFGTGMAILTSVYTPQQRGKAMGWSISLTYLGLTLGPALGGFINQHLGWRSIFYLTSVIGLLAAFLIWKGITGEWHGSADEKFDGPGSLLYAMGLAFFLYGFSSLTSFFWAWTLAVLGLSLLGAFVWLELRIPHPLMHLHLFHNPAFAYSNLAAMINYCATFAVTFLLSVYLQVVQGYSSQTAGMILLIQPVLMSLFSPISGALSDRMEPRLVASLGMTLNAICLFGLAFIHTGTSITYIITMLPLLGLGFALFSSPNTNAVMSSVMPRYYGVASSTVGTMRMVGQSIAMAMTTLIITAYLGNAAFSSASSSLIVASLRTSFAIFAFLSLAGIAASLARGNVHDTANAPGPDKA